MAACRGANEAIVADAPLLPERHVALGDGVAVLLWGDPAISGRALDLLAMFINTGDEHHLLAFQALKPCQRITRQCGVSAAQMGLVVDVIQGGREAVGHLSDVSPGNTQPLCWLDRWRWILTTVAHRIDLLSPLPLPDEPERLDWNGMFP